MTIEMRTPILTLGNLEKALPNANSLVYEFGNFLNLRLRERLFVQAENFSSNYVVSELKQALDDLSSGFCSYTGAEIFGNLVGRSPQVYQKLRTCLPEIVRVTFPQNSGEILYYLKATGVC